MADEQRDCADPRSSQARNVRTIDSKTAPAVSSGSATPPSDEDALARMRSGDHDAYVILYERHAGAARRLAARIMSNRSDVDDVVAEVFAASFAAIRRGRGPRDDFGPYVLSAVRRECYRVLRRRGRRRETPAGPEVVERSALPDEPVDHAERAVLETAFGALTPNLQTVLWLTEVEGLSHGEIAMRTASTGPAVAAMAMRARRALAEQYLGAHSAAATGRLAQDCRETRKSLAGVVRGSGSDRKRRRVEEHVAHCSDCAGVHHQLQTVNHRLRNLAPPLLVASLGSVPLFPGGLRGQWAGWTAGHGAAVVAVGGAVTASVVLPAAIDRNLPDTFGDTAAATATSPNEGVEASDAGGDEAGGPSGSPSGTGQPGSPDPGPVGAADPERGRQSPVGSGGRSVEVAPWAIAIAPTPSGPLAEAPPVPTSSVASASPTTSGGAVTLPGALPATVPSAPDVTVPPVPAVTLPSSPGVSAPVTATVTVPVTVPDVGVDPDPTAPTAPISVPALPTPDGTPDPDVPTATTVDVGSGVDPAPGVDGPVAEVPAPAGSVTLPTTPLGAAPLGEPIGG